MRRFTVILLTLAVVVAVSLGYIRIRKAVHSPGTYNLLGFRILEVQTIYPEEEGGAIITLIKADGRLEDFLARTYEHTDLRKANLEEPILHTQGAGNWWSPPLQADVVLGADGEMSTWHIVVSSVGPNLFYEQRILPGDDSYLRSLRPAL